jgi:hypothetical protein
MATPISEVYDSFLSMITDYTLLLDTLTEAEINEELFGYFKKARTKFYRCKNSLEVVDDGFGELEFTIDLDPFEIEVLATLMSVEYLKPQILSSEVLKQSLSDKDFKIYSQANQIRELRLLYNTLKAEANKLIVEYTYLDLGKDENK